VAHPVGLTKTNSAFDTQNGAEQAERPLSGVEAMVVTDLDCADHAPFGVLWRPSTAPGLESICGAHSSSTRGHPGPAPLGPHRTPTGLSLHYYCLSMCGGV